jgi:benzoate/toluate 1,2-dioxygenase reductase subunit
MCGGTGKAGGAASVGPGHFRLDDPVIQADPYAFYPRLRSEQPVLRTMVGDEPWWVVSRHEDVVKALMDPATFSSRIFPDPNLLFSDPPDHERLRKMVAPWFSRRAVDQLTGPITEHADILAQQIVARGQCDIVEDFAAKLTVTMISGMLGVAPGDVEDLRQLQGFLTEWFEMLLAVRRGVEPSPRARAAGERFDGLIGRVIDEASFREGGLVAKLVGHLNAGELTRAECVSYINILFGAGHSTTTDLIGNAVYILAHSPEYLGRISSDAEFVPLFIEEVLRTRPSFHRISRVTTRDVDIAGQPIPAGSMVRLLLAAANRDPAVHDDGETFDPDLPRRANLAFGRGIHTCLGSWLARLETMIALRALASHASGIELDSLHGPVSQTGGAFNNFGFRHLHVRLSPAAG